MNSIILSILMTFVSNRKVTREYLSKKYEISKRTVSRYIDTLIESGVPILSTTGFGGGYMLPDDYKIDKTFLTPGELDRITNALNATKDNFEDKLNDYIIDKFSIFNETKAENSYLLNNNHLIIDAGSWTNPAKYRNKINALNNAMTGKKTILIKYVDRFESYSERLIDPYNLVLKQGVWYFYGWCHRREDYRLFKLSRISYISITDNTFISRSDADVYEKLSGQFDIYNGIDIEIQFSCTVLSQIEEWLGFDSIYEEGLDYRAVATLPDGNELVSKILSFGSSVKVISPQALKEEVLIECSRILENT